MIVQKEFNQRNLHLGILNQPDVMTWRYLDLPKFMALLESSALFFCRADLFQDKHEGSFTRSSIEFREKIWREQMPNIPSDHFDSILSVRRFLNKEEKKNFYINCWHMSNHESIAMWELYGAKNQSIAIQSTYRTLREIMPNNGISIDEGDKKHVDLGIVQYLDYENDPMPQIYTFDPFLRKRISFAHEKELRLFYQAPPQSGQIEKEGDSYIFTQNKGTIISSPSGVEFQVDLHKLIKNIYISPGSPNWFYSLLKSIIDRYGLKTKIVLSSLDNSPIY